MDPQRHSDRPDLQTPSSCPQKEDLSAGRPVAGSEEAAQRGDVPRRDLGKDRLARRHEPQSCSGQGQPLAATTRPLLRLDRHLDPPGEAVADREQTPAAVLKAADVASIAASPGKSRMDKLATGPVRHQAEPASITEGNENHVEHAGRGSQALRELSQELGPHRCAKVAVSQRSPDPVGIDVGSHQMVGGEGNHRVNRSRWRRQNLDHAVGRRKPAGGRVPKHIHQPMLCSCNRASPGGAHDSSLTETVCPHFSASQESAYRLLLRRRASLTGLPERPTMAPGKMAGMDPNTVELRDVPCGSGATCSQILATLPAWFGIEAANQHYAEVSERSPAVIASADGHDIGLAVIVLHSVYSAEIDLMAVRPEWHRHGIGRRLVEHAEGTLARSGVEFLQVKTLSDKHPDAGYKRTRAFYTACGFRPLEEFPTLWGPANPALQLIKRVQPRAGSFRAARGHLHHLEMWVPDLHRAAQSWGWLLETLGYRVFQNWPDGRSWRQGDHFVVIERSPALAEATHDRSRPMLNHAAFHAGTTGDVDQLVDQAVAHGWTLVFPDRHPHAGEPDHYAAYLEDADGFEVELVAEHP